MRFRPLRLTALATLLVVVILLALESRYLSHYNAQCLAGQNVPGDPENSRAEVKLAFQQQQRKFIFFKTWKTASTSLGNILYRFGLNYGLRFHCLPKDRPLEVENPLGGGPTRHLAVCHHNMPSAGVNSSSIISWYRGLVPGGQLLTILRDPLQVSRSAFNFFIKPVFAKATYEKFLREHKVYHNSMTHLLGVTNKRELDHFIKEELDDFFVFIAEKFDECLLLFADRFGWTMEDILYVRLNKCGSNNHLNQTTSCDEPDDLKEDPAMQRKAREVNKLDLALYDLARARLELLLSTQPPAFWSRLQRFKQANSLLSAYCDPASSTTGPEPRCDAILNFRYHETIDQRTGLLLPEHSSLADSPGMVLPRIESSSGTLE